MAASGFDTLAQQRGIAAVCGSDIEETINTREVKVAVLMAGSYESEICPGARAPTNLPMDASQV